MDDIDPDMACELTQFCPKPGFALARPGAVDAFHVLWKELAAAKPEGQNRLGDEESCQNCKTIILQAVAILQVRCVDKMSCACGCLCWSVGV